MNKHKKFFNSVYNLSSNTYLFCIQYSHLLINNSKSLLPMYWSQ